MEDTRSMKVKTQLEKVQKRVRSIIDNKEWGEACFGSWDEDNVEFGELLPEVVQKLRDSGYYFFRNDTFRIFWANAEVCLRLNSAYLKSGIYFRN